MIMLIAFGPGCVYSCGRKRRDSKYHAVVFVLWLCGPLPCGVLPMRSVWDNARYFIRVTSSSINCQAVRDIFFPR